MALRVLSGHLTVGGTTNGRATIRYADNSLSGAPPGVGIGSALTAGDPMPRDGKFHGNPTFMVAIRQLKIEETEWVRGSWHEGKEIEHLKIDTARFDDQEIEIVWESSGGSRIEEISYMIIGNV